MERSTFASVWAPVEGSIFTANAKQHTITSHKVVFYLGAYEFLRLIGTIPTEDEAVARQVIDGYVVELKAELAKHGFQVPA